MHNACARDPQARGRARSRTSNGGLNGRGRRDLAWRPRQPRAFHRGDQALAGPARRLIFVIPEAREDHPAEQNYRRELRTCESENERRDVRRDRGLRRHRWGRRVSSDSRRRGRLRQRRRLGRSAMGTGRRGAEKVETSDADDDHPRRVDEHREADAVPSEVPSAQCDREPHHQPEHDVRYGRLCGNQQERREQPRHPGRPGHATPATSSRSPSPSSAACAFQNSSVRSNQSSSVSRSPRCKSTFAVRSTS